MMLNDLLKLRLVSFENCFINNNNLIAYYSDLVMIGSADVEIWKVILLFSCNSSVIWALFV